MQILSSWSIDWKRDDEENQTKSTYTEFFLVLLCWKTSIWHTQTVAHFSLMIFGHSQNGNKKEWKRHSTFASSSLHVCEQHVALLLESGDWWKMIKVSALRSWAILLPHRFSSMELASLEIINFIDMAWPDAQFFFLLILFQQMINARRFILFAYALTAE